MGKKKYIETPAKLWELFEAYKTSVKENPRVVYDFVGRDGTRVEKPIERPLTIEGFKVFCYNNGATFDHYLKNTDNAYGEYRPIVQRVRDEIRCDQLDGAFVNQYNANLTARVNSIKEHTETTVTEQPLFGEDKD